jgi:F-type H+-transporting ATPase subunit gamma
MTTLKEIRRRIASVESTQKITRAMKMVAAAKLKRAQDEATDARRYADEIEGLVYRVSQSVGVEAPELMRRRTDPRYVDLLIVSSDRGLCGGFNENLLNRVEDIVAMHERHGVRLQLFVYGKRGVLACQKRRLNVSHAEELGAEAVDLDRVNGIVDVFIHRFLNRYSDGAFVAYNYFRSKAAQDVMFKDMLPLHQRRVDRAYQMEYLYEPSREDVLPELVHKSLVSILMQVFRESHASELASRMKAMDAATKNADDMIEHLTMLYHRARQRAITRELMDIVNGAEALRQ